MDDGRSRLFVPIRAERFRDQSRLSDVIAPPYDVLSPAGRAELAARSSHNIVHLTLPVGRPDPYAAAAAVLARWREEAALVREAAPCVYVVQQDFLTPDGRRYVRTGVIGGLGVEGYDGGRVRPHERTHGGPKEDRYALGQAIRCAPEPIFALVRDGHGHLKRRLEGVTKHEPTVTGDFDGGAVGVWRVGRRPRRSRMRWGMARSTSPTDITATRRPRRCEPPCRGLIAFPHWLCLPTIQV